MEKARKLQTFNSKKNGVQFCKPRWGCKNDLRVFSRIVIDISTMVQIAVKKPVMLDAFVLVLLSINRMGCKRFDFRVNETW